MPNVMNNLHWNKAFTSTSAHFPWQFYQGKGGKLNEFIETSEGMNNIRYLLTGTNFHDCVYSEVK